VFFMDKALECLSKDRKSKLPSARIALVYSVERGDSGHTEALSIRCVVRSATRRLLAYSEIVGFGEPMSNCRRQSAWRYRYKEE
jgi:hypothetical protein